MNNNNTELPEYESDASDLDGSGTELFAWTLLAILTTSFTIMFIIIVLIP